MSLVKHNTGVWDWDQVCDPISCFAQETGQEFSLFIKLPKGFSKQDLRVSVTDDILTLLGEKSGASSSTEATFQPFSRSIRLPNYIASEAITAAFLDDGQLQMTLPKKFGRQAVAFEVPLSPAAPVDYERRQQLDRMLLANKGDEAAHSAETETKLKMAEQRRKSLQDEEVQRVKQHLDHVKEVHDKMQSGAIPTNSGTSNVGGMYGPGGFEFGKPPVSGQATQYQANQAQPQHQSQPQYQSQPQHQSQPQYQSQPQHQAQPQYHAQPQHQSQPNVSSTGLYQTAPIPPNPQMAQNQYPSSMPSAGGAQYPSVMPSQHQPTGQQQQQSFVSYPPHGNQITSGPMSGAQPDQFYQQPIGPGAARPASPII